MELFTPEIVRLHLARILASPPFAESVVLSRFLTFIVNETLGGRSHELKEYTIAIEALKKDADFNPQIDAIVRIHACRLRRALKEYYYEHDTGDVMQILLRKGSYVPTFVPNTSDRPVDTAHNTVHVATDGNGSKLRNVLAILPFEDVSETKIHTSFVKGLDVYLSTYLTMNPNLCLVSNLSSAHLPERIKDVREAGVYLNASFILTGCIQFDKHLRIHVLLNMCSTGEQLWGMTMGRKDVEMSDLFLLQEEIVNSIGASLDRVVEKYTHGNRNGVSLDMNSDNVAAVLS